MCESIAIVAHFNGTEETSKNFYFLVETLSSVFDKVIIVSTSGLHRDSISGGGNVVLINRPNVGYDFYSYRVGMTYVKENFKYGAVLLTNSSYFITDRKLYRNTLYRLLDKLDDCEVRGVTKSLQFSCHIQSYMMVLGRSIVEDTRIERFFSNVEPLSSKFEVILRYEVGFSNALLELGYKLSALYTPSRLTYYRSLFKWMSVVLRGGTFKALIGRVFWSKLSWINWVHFGADEIAKQFGIVKAEVLRTNPHNIDIDVITAFESDECKSIHEELLRSKDHYHKLGNGLSAFRAGTSPLPLYRPVSNGNLGREGVRVAVVLHLYYLDLLDEIIDLFSHIVEPFDLYITTPHEGDISKILNRCVGVASGLCIHLSENRGRDVGPFLSLYLEGALDRYKAVLKLHSKKSRYSDAGSQWRHKLYSKVLNSSEMFKVVMDKLCTGRIGIIGPQEYYLSNDRFWGANRATVQSLYEMCFPCAQEDVDLGFFAGTMFWFNPEAFKPLLNINRDYLNFPDENGMQDGTLAHAIERLFCPVSRGAGFLNTSVQLGFIEIHNTPTLDNTVPVL